MPQLTTGPSLAYADTDDRPQGIDDETATFGRPDRIVRTALVIDADPLVARSLEMILSAEAFTVETASGGAEGVCRATAKAFELIVVGAELQDMTCQEAMNRIRLAGGKAVIVVASVTAATTANAAMLNLSAPAEVIDAPTWRADRKATS